MVSRFAYVRADPVSKIKRAREAEETRRVGEERRGKESRGKRACSQKTHGKDGQDADLAPGWDIQFGDAVEREEEDGKIRDDVDEGSGDEGGLEIDAAALERGVPDAGARDALEDGGAEVGEIEGEVGPDEDVDEVVSFAGTGGVEEAAVHEEDGKLGEEDGGAIKHFGRVCELMKRDLVGPLVARVVRDSGQWMALPLQIR